LLGVRHGEENATLRRAGQPPRRGCLAYRKRRQFLDAADIDTG
jgi:hypothetical protein